MHDVVFDEQDQAFDKDIDENTIIVFFHHQSFFGQMQSFSFLYFLDAVLSPLLIVVVDGSCQRNSNNFIYVSTAECFDSSCCYLMEGR